MWRQGFECLDNRPGCSVSCDSERFLHIPHRQHMYVASRKSARAGRLGHRPPGEILRQGLGLPVSIPSGRKYLRLQVALLRVSHCADAVQNFMT